MINFRIDENSIHLGNFINIGLDKLHLVMNKSLKIIFIIIIMYISIRIGKYGIKKFVEKQVESNAVFSLDPQRAKTLGEVLKSVLKYTVYFMGGTIIASFFLNGISFTFASIGGIAVGLGAQSLIKDLINGFFILFENQFVVGDHVTIGSFNGIVQSIGIRATVIKDFNGDIHSIPNGGIGGVTNHSRNDITFLVDVDIFPTADLDKAMDIIKNVCIEFKNENEEYITEELEVLGIVDLGISKVTIRVGGKSKPLMQFKMERKLRMKIKNALDKNMMYCDTKNEQFQNKEKEIEIEMEDK